MNIITRNEAKDLNLVRYYTGKPCQNGHDSERYVNNERCVACNTNGHRRHVIKNKESIKKYDKQYRTDNKERIKLDKKKWHTKNKEKNNEYCRKYGKENPEKIAYLAAKKRAIKLQATPPWHETELIKQIYLKRDELSKLWGIILHVDHTIPLQGKNICGLHCWANLQLLEDKLNNTKYNIFNDE